MRPEQRKRATRAVQGWGRGRARRLPAKQSAPPAGQDQPIQPALF
jgi:hypothetical protein